MKPTQQTATEKRLRQSVPPLPAPDDARVARACARILSAEPPARTLWQPSLLIRPLLRVAAAVALLVGAALLLRVKPQPAAVAASPSAVFNDLATLMSAPTLKNTLAGEEDDLVSDLTDLTAVLSARAQAILF